MLEGKEKILSLSPLKRFSLLNMEGCVLQDKVDRLSPLKRFSVHQVSSFSHLSIASSFSLMISCEPILICMRVYKPARIMA